MAEASKLTSEGLVEREGYLSANELAALKDLACMVKENPKVLNIGSGMGTSALALLEVRDDILIYSIDIEDVSDLGSLRREREALEEAGMWDPARITQLHGDSREVGKAWEHGLVDLVFVDDGHYYEHVKGDIETWLPFIRNDGLIIFHDYKGQYDMGVSQAVDELMGEHEQIAHVDTLIAFKVKKRKLTSRALSACYDFRYLDLDGIKGLKELACSLGPDPVVVNLGAGFGTSALAFMEARDDLCLITVDYHEEETPIGSLSCERDSMRKAGFLDDPRYEQMQGFTVEIGKSWDRDQVDMVFVDAGHSYEACKGDLLAWIPHVVDGGIIAIHDYWDRYFYEVIKAVDEVMEDYERIMLVGCLIAFRIKKESIDETKNRRPDISL